MASLRGLKILVITLGVLILAAASMLVYGLMREPQITVMDHYMTENGCDPVHAVSWPIPEALGVVKHLQLDGGYVVVVLQSVESGAESLMIFHPCRLSNPFMLEMPVPSQENGRPEREE